MSGCASAPHSFASRRGEMHWLNVGGGSAPSTLRTKLATDLPRVSADPIQLQEVLLSLVMNAVEAMDSTAENLRVLTIASMSDAEGVRVTVEDSGIGIDAKKTEQIFEAFFTTKPAGMGMGLVICRSIIAAHDGRLWASPGPSGGTVFHVFLPFSAGDASSGQPSERDRVQQNR